MEGCRNKPLPVGFILAAKGLRKEAEGGKAEAHFMRSEFLVTPV